jgi:hypothetical protein
MSTAFWLTGICTLVLAVPPLPGPPAPALLPAGASATGAGGASNIAFVTRLKTQFDATDLDHNAFLDKSELAKVFRGPKAVPPAQGMYDDQGHLSKVYYEARTKYPDLIFLWGADKDADDMVSWPEYKNYELKVLAAQQQMQQALQRSLRPPTSRRTSTRSTGRGRTTVRTVYRNSRSGSNHSYGHSSGVRHSYHAPQNQMVNGMANVQRNQAMMQANYQRAYQEGMRQRALAQQRMVNYVREQQTAYYRLAQRQMHAVAEAQAHRRR